MDQGLSNLPDELFPFFRSPVGHSLLIRGEPGAGKTTMALQIIEEMSDHMNGFFLSARVSDVLVLSQFPWLAEKLFGRDIADWIQQQVGLSQEALMNKISGRGDLEEGEHLDGLRCLKGGQIINTGETDFEELDRIYESVQGERPNKALVVIDSLEGLAEKYGREPSELVKAIQKDLVEGYGANVVFVLENEPTTLDYLGDGVVTLETRERHNRILREMRINKLRGCRINRHRYLFTLQGGRMYCFSPSPDDIRVGSRTQGELSLGLQDIDRLLDGGLSGGGVTMVETGPQVPSGMSSFLETCLVAHHARSGKGIIWLPSGKTDKGSQALVKDLIGSEAFEQRVRVLEPISRAGSLEANRIHLEGDDPANDLDWRKISYSIQGAQGPLVAVMGIDSLEAIYGKQVLDQISEFLRMVSMEGGSFVGFASSTVSSLERVGDMSDTRLKMERVNGTVLVYGEEPLTVYHAVEDDEEGGVNLIPIV